MPRALSAPMRAKLVLASMDVVNDHPLHVGAGSVAIR